MNEFPDLACWKLLGYWLNLAKWPDMTLIQGRDYQRPCVWLAQGWNASSRSLCLKSPYKIICSVDPLIQALYVLKVVILHLGKLLSNISGFPAALNPHVISKQINHMLSPNVILYNNYKVDRDRNTKGVPRLVSRSNLESLWKAAVKTNRIIQSVVSSHKRLQNWSHT